MLWMVRAFPDQIDRKEEFLENDIIAVYWGVGDLTECLNKHQIEESVAQLDLAPRDASLKVGLLDRFRNLMQPNDYVIVPYHDVFYTGIIKSDYYFDPNSQRFEHQRKVEWLFDKKSFSRDELPEAIQITIKSQLGLVGMDKHESIFMKYLNHKLGIETDDLSNDSNGIPQTESELNSLVVDALKIIKDEINSDDPDRRLKAAIAVMELSFNPFDRK